MDLTNDYANIELENEDVRKHLVCTYCTFPNICSVVIQFVGSCFELLIDTVDQVITFLVHLEFSIGGGYEKILDENEDFERYIMFFIILYITRIGKSRYIFYSKKFSNLTWELIKRLGN